MPGDPVPLEANAPRRRGGTRAHGTGHTVSDRGRHRTCLCGRRRHPATPVPPGGSANAHSNRAGADLQRRHRARLCHVHGSSLAPACANLPPLPHSPPLSHPTRPRPRRFLHPPREPDAGGRVTVPKAAKPRWCPERDPSRDAQQELEKSNKRGVFACPPDLGLRQSNQPLCSESGEHDGGKHHGDVRECTPLRQCGVAQVGPRPSA
mmetsp:Transcript_4600/g.11031  ORF Transcript_4600/g.11031 Transcript_4600/m.11031 type:complete len:207 (+) Transcript_4600:1030-1650(+)